MVARSGSRWGRASDGKGDDAGVSGLPGPRWSGAWRDSWAESGLVVHLGVVGWCVWLYAGLALGESWGLAGQGVGEICSAAIFAVYRRLTGPRVLVASCLESLLAGVRSLAHSARLGLVSAGGLAWGWMPASWSAASCWARVPALGLPRLVHRGILVAGRRVGCVCVSLWASRSCSAWV